MNQKFLTLRNRLESCTVIISFHEIMPSVHMFGTNPKHGHLDLTPAGKYLLEPIKDRMDSLMVRISKQLPLAIGSRLRPMHR